VPASVPKSRVIALQGGLNFRDLGGYSGASGRLTRWRHLFRSGTPHLLTSADRERLAELNIQTVVDLRSNSERQQNLHPLFGQPGLSYWAHDYDGVTANLMKMIVGGELDAARARAAMVDLYRDLPYELTAIYRQLFLSVSRCPLPLLFNCAAGKDRTGVAAALLLSTVGVDWQDVVADYLLTQSAVSDIVRSLHLSDSNAALQALSPPVLMTLVGVDQAYLEGMRDAIITRSGSLENYLTSELRLDPDVLAAVRERILDGEGPPGPLE
jgi:protein-tyrosine phosphatase